MRTNRTTILKRIKSKTLKPQNEEFFLDNADEVFIPNPRTQLVSRIFPLNDRASIHLRLFKKYTFCLDAKYLKLFHFGTYRPERLYLELRILYQVIHLTFIEIEFKENLHIKNFSRTIFKIIRFADHEMNTLCKR